MINEELTQTNQPQEIEIVQETMEALLAVADVSAVYGEPIEHGDTIIIPAAEVLCGMGFGLGYGEGSESVADREGKDTPRAGNSGRGGGGGGGGRSFSRPVAVIVAEPDGVRVEPVVDVTKIALAALTAAGFMLGMIARMSRGEISKH